MSESIWMAQGGGIQSNRAEFIDGNTRALWVAVFVFFITWLLGLFLTPIIGWALGRTKPFPASPGGAGGEEGGVSSLPAGAPGPGARPATASEETSHWAARIANFTRAARDSFLILLGTTLVNMAGHGASGGVVVLTWIVFALLAVWTWLYLIFHWKKIWWAEMLLLLVVLVLQIINFALAFRTPDDRQ